MKKIISEKTARILKNKKRLEEKLNIKISNRGKEIYLKGKATDEYISDKIIGAIEFGFPFKVALLIKEEDFLFEIISIKDFTNKKNLERIRGRIIGRGGKTLKTLSGITKCFFELKDNEVGIIGSPESIQSAREGLISLIRGSKQSNVYSYLEKHHPKPILDLGLKK